MALGIVNIQEIQNIADAIRTATGKVTTMTLANMPTEIGDISPQIETTQTAYDNMQTHNASTLYIITG